MKNSLESNIQAWIRTLKMNTTAPFQRQAVTLSLSSYAPQFQAFHSLVLSPLKVELDLSSLYSFRR